MLLIGLEPAMQFILNFMLFLLGLHGINFFTQVHAIIASVEASKFSKICTLLCASVIIYILCTMG
ncbi:hypothetical protein ACTFST_09885 [Bacillus cereus group sp. MYBK106-1]|uniref:hypothetical protein n=1 Tax=unclassified Bacillus cereus group TaxID=2750818 RepID=UPI003F799534